MKRMENVVTMMIIIRALSVDPMRLCWLQYFNSSVNLLAAMDYWLCVSACLCVLVVLSNADSQPQ